MGQDKSNPFREDGQIMSEYEIEQRNAQLSISYLRQKKTSKEFLLRELTFNELRQFNLYGQKLKSRKNIKHKNVTNLEIIEERKDDHLCSNYFKLYTLWEYPRRNLADQIIQRVKSNKRFDNQQLRQILESAVNGMAALQQNDMRHECLTTKVILIEENKNIKIADPNCTGLLTNIESLYNNRSLKNIYLSPEQCQSIQTQKPIMKKNPYKNDVFTLGMIILECGLLQHQNECYLDDCSRIVWERISAHLNQFAQVYDPFLTKIVQSLLVKDINNRPDWIQLQKYFGKDNSQFSNPNQIPSQSSGRSGIGLVRQTAFQNHKPAFSYQPTLVYAGQEPTFTKYMSNGPGTLAMIPSVSNQGSSMYSQRVSHSNQGQLNPSHVFQTSYSNISSVPQNSLISPVGGSAGTSYYNPSAEVPHRLTQTMSNRPYQPLPLGKIQYLSNANLPPAYLINLPSVQMSSPSSTSFPSNNQVKIQQRPYQVLTDTNLQHLANNSNHQLGATFSNYAPSSFHQAETITQKQVISNHTFQNNFNKSPAYNPPQIFTLPSTGFEYKPKLKNSQYINFSPTISNYIRPAQSINYEANKVQSPVQLKQEDSKPVDSIDSNPFDVNLTKSPDKLDSSQSDFQPQYVEEYFKMGSRYEGYKVNGMRHGKGKFYYQDGGSYQGDWKQNKMNGYGILYYQSNVIAYQGQWVNDRFSGFGKLYNQNPIILDEGFDYTNFDDIEEHWQFYEGNFTDDLKNGQGMLKFSNGEFFEGNFKDDMVEGEGVFSSRDGQKIHGNWSENHLQS